LNVPDYVSTTSRTHSEIVSVSAVGVFNPQTGANGGSLVAVEGNDTDRCLHGNSANDYTVFADGNAMARCERHAANGCPMVS